MDSTNQQIVDKCKNLLDQINEKLNSNVLIEKNTDKPLQHIEKTSSIQQINNVIDSSDSKDITTLDDIAIIQCFYGIDIDRISATTRALQHILKSTYLPKEWIFIEAQNNKSDACFSWLKKYGIKYIFKKLPKDSYGIFMKMSLWNIGVDLCSSNKLCFIDSDVIFKNSAWLKSVDEAFQKYNVLSLSKECLYENEDQKENDAVISTGRCIQDGSIVKEFGHAGFTFGCTRDVFKNKIKRFVPSIILVDIYLWANIIGKELSSIKNKWITLPLMHEDGLDVDVGSTEETCIHMFHGKKNERRYRQLTEIIKDHVQSIDEIFCYDEQGLPFWNTSNEFGRIIKQSVKRALDEEDKDKSGIDIYFENVKKEFGEIDDQHQLVVCTTFVPDFQHRVQNIIKFKNMLTEKIQNSFQFICFTNYQSELFEQNEIDVIPLSRKFNKKDAWKEILRKDVEFPKDSIMVFIDSKCNLENNIKIYNPGKQMMFRNDDIVLMNDKNYKFDFNIRKIIKFEK